MNQKKILSLAGVSLITLIWGYAFIIVKEAVDVMPVTYMLSARFSIAFIALSAIYFYKYKLLNMSYILQGLILGLLLYLMYYFQTYGCLYTTAGKNAFLTTIYVIIVPFINWLIVKSKPTKFNIIAGFMALTGIGLLSLNGDLSINIGDILTIICGFFVALHLIYVSKYAKTNDAILLSVLQLGFASLIGWIVVIISGEAVETEIFTANIINSLLYLGILSTMVANVLQNVCQKYLSPSVTSLILSAESVVAMIFSVWLLGETLTVKMIIGCILIFTSICISELKHYPD